MAKDDTYDAFISHAVEDKLGIANELSGRLEAAGLTIWYSGSELNAGDSVNDVILEGLRKSRYGIVILSKNYLAKNWTMKELHFLMSKERPDRKVILPVLYDVTPEDLAAKDIDLADRFALRADKGMDHLVKKLVAEITRGKQTEKRRAGKKARRRWLAGAAAVVILSAGTYTGTQLYNTTTREYETEAVVENYIAGLESRIRTSSIDELPDIERAQVSPETIRQAFREFSDVKSYYRNAYTLITPDTTIRFRKNVEPALDVEMTALVPVNNFGFIDPILYLLSDSIITGVRQVRYKVENSLPLIYSQEALEAGAGYRKIRVRYENNIRAIHTTLDFPDEKGIKWHSVVIYGFLPKETYVLRKEGSRWDIFPANDSEGSRKSPESRVRHSETGVYF